MTVWRAEKLIRGCHNVYPEEQRVSSLKHRKAHIRSRQWDVCLVLA